MPADVREVAPNVFLGRGTDVNWYLLRDGRDLTLIDCGYPGDYAAVEASIRALGARPEDVQALLLTHAHVDHIGAANRLHDRYGVSTYADPAEVPHAQREYLEQASPLDVARNLWRPGAAPWLARILAKGAMSKRGIPHAEPFPSAGALDLPGRPLPVATHGHTSGHSAYHLPDAGAVITGDGLITAHPVVRSRSPQVTPAFFNHGDAVAGLAPLEGLAADLILPGHGDPLRRPIATAVAEARAHRSPT